MASSSVPLDAPVDRPVGPEDPRTNLIVNYLPQTMTDAELEEIFTGCGMISSCKIVRTPGTGYSHGYGFINYANCGAAAAAVLELNGFCVANKRLKVSYSRPNCNDIKDTNLYVAHLGPSITEEALEDMFKVHGTILTRKLLRDPSGRPRGTGFVRFNTKQEANDAIEAINGKKSMPGAHMPIHVKIAEDQGKQKGGPIPKGNA